MVYLITFSVYIFISVLLSGASKGKTKWNLNLPNKHLSYIFSHHQNLAKSCLLDDDCPYKKFLNVRDHCWGYEDNCEKDQSYSKQESRNCASKNHEKDFWFRADFGYIENILKEMKTLEICSPEHPSDSSLTCSRYMRYCKASNIYMDFREHKPEKDRYKADMFQKGMIGGHCKMNHELLENQGEHAYPLQSWYAELQNYTSLDFQPFNQNSHCDIIIEKPTILMKLDSGINLYHHFCDFFNLYLSQHVNNSWFDKDVQIVMWDTSSLGYFDIFAKAWNAFTDHPVIKLSDWTGKRVCLRDAMFPLLPRMRGGLYYNSYIPRGCIGSSMFQAFSEFFLHRMDITQEPPIDQNNSTKIRVTLLERGKPEDEHIYRKIKNQDQLIAVMKEFSDFDVQVVQYKWQDMSLEKQLQITHNSDIFIGMHGAGLLHFLFLPDWAVAFELYNCDDDACYYELARLRGLDYITWNNGKVEAFDKNKHKRYGDNPKFWNWSFDPAEFRILIKKARMLLLRNPKFQQRMWSTQDKMKKHAEL